MILEKNLIQRFQVNYLNLIDILLIQKLLEILNKLLNNLINQLSKLQ